MIDLQDWCAQRLMICERRKKEKEMAKAIKREVVMIKLSKKCLVRLDAERERERERERES